MKVFLILVLIMSITINGYLYQQKKNKPVKIITPAYLATHSDLAKKSKIELYKNLPLLKGDVIFIGTSITEGFPVTEMFKNIKFKNRGVSGAIIEELAELSTFVSTQKPAVVYLEIGINDVKNSITWNEEDQEAFILKYEEIIKTFKKESITVKVNAIMPVNDLYFENKSAEMNNRIVISNRLIQTLCKKEDVVFIDIYSSLLNNNQLKPEFTFDGLHLNSYGYDIWFHILQNKS